MSKSDSPRSDTTIDEVQKYWNENPVHSVEFSPESDQKEYLQSIDNLRWSDNERWAKDRFYDFEANPGEKLLDAGCGIGVFSRYYARKGFDLHAIDITPNAVAITQQSLDLFDLKGTVRQGSVEDMPFADNEFDYVVSNGVIHHTPNTEKAADEIYRVLKPGGTASICIYYRNVLLRQPLWSIVRRVLPLLLAKTAGREKMATAKTPEDLARVYDGNDTPIARVYSRDEANALFSKFETVAVEPHYFPARFLKGFSTGGFVHKILDATCGLLIYYRLRKPTE
ncbi:MAG: class I SAM-dependent methyltransferase [Pseudodesulfovibrio sp.]